MGVGGRWENPNQGDQNPKREKIKAKDCLVPKNQ